MIKQAHGIDITLIERKDEFIYNEQINSYISNWIEEKTNMNFMKVNLSDCNPQTIIRFINGGLSGKIKKLLILECHDLKLLEMKMGDSKQYKGKIPILFDELKLVLPKYRNVKVIVSVPEFNKQLKSFKTILELGTVIPQEKRTFRQFLSFAKSRCELYHINMDKEVLKYFLSLVDENYAIIDSELYKLSLLNTKDIDKFTINRNVMKSKKVLVFELIRSMGSRRANTSMALLEELIVQGTTALQIIALLQRNFRILFYMKLKLDLSEFKLNKWSMKNYNEELRRFDLDEIVQLLSDLCWYERLLKSSSINEWFVLTMMIFEAL